MNSNNIRILLLGRYSRNGSSTRVRYLQYIPYLVERGFDVTCSPLLPESYLTSIYNHKSRWNYRQLGYYLNRIKSLWNIKKYNLIWLEKEIYPWLPAWLEILFGIHGVPYVVDYDDAVFHRYDLHENWFIRKVLGKKIDVVMRRSAFVVVGNRYLADRAHLAKARNIEIIPTVIDLKRYVIDSVKRQSGTFYIGWIGSPGTARYVKEKLPLFQSIIEERGIKLVLVGSDGEIAESPDVIVRKWTEESEVEEINRFDVGIMPLMNTPWEEGKCGYKLIQYMACGKPVIASPVGVNKVIIRHGWNGYLANSDEEWRWAINSLMKSSKLAAEMGANGRKLVEEKYTVQSNVGKLADIFRIVAEKRNGIISEV